MYDIFWVFVSKWWFRESVMIVVSFFPFHSCKMMFNNTYFSVCSNTDVFWYCFYQHTGSPWRQKRRGRHPNATKDPTYVWSLGWLQYHRFWRYHLTWTSCNFCTQVCTTTILSPSSLHFITIWTCQLNLGLEAYNKLNGMNLPEPGEKLLLKETPSCNVFLSSLWFWVCWRI